MQRLNCESYPCHFPDQDCSLCFCPFYPCKDSRTGGREVDGAWSCQSCRIIHMSNVAEMVLDALMRGESIGAVWKNLEALL
ncbi:MAG: cysteine-rich small domain-containing protein [Methanothrix sp.]|jgi:Zn-finger protein|nr:cysteine-rich small domain-containing protein [Methanothrix sp.]